VPPLRRAPKPLLAPWRTDAAGKGGSNSTTAVSGTAAIIIGRNSALLPTAQRLLPRRRACYRRARRGWSPGDRRKEIAVDRRNGSSSRQVRPEGCRRRQYGRQQCHVARSCQCPRCSKDYDNAHHSGADLKHRERQRNTGTTVLSAASRAAEPSRNCWIHCTGQRHELRHVTAAHQRVRQLRIREQSAPCEILTMCSKSMPMRASHRKAIINCKHMHSSQWRRRTRPQPRLIADRRQRGLKGERLTRKKPLAGSRTRRSAIKQVERSRLRARTWPLRKNPVHPR
jgi:hypothetical protein